MLSLSRARRDEGVSIVLVALLLLVFLAFAAMATDLGTVFVARRTDQNAADAAALAGAQEILGTEGEIADTVIAYAEEDLGVTGLDWDSCDDDTGKLIDIVDGKNCITRDETLLRVKTPPRAVEAVFGKALGETTYEHSAFAIAGVTREGFGGVLPFGLFTNESGHICLRTDNPSSPVSPCNGTATGDSGLLNLNFYGSVLQGTEVDCNPSNSAGPNGRLKNNVASGIDHIVRRRVTLGDPPLYDQDDCPDKSDPRPNGADTVPSAGAMQGLAIGMFSGDADEFEDGQPARLRRAAEVDYQSRITIEGVNVDDTPLWQFIGDGSQAPTNVPASCQRSVFTNARANPSNISPAALATHLAGLSVELRMEKLLERCFAHYNVGGTWSDGTGAGAYPAEARTGCSEPLAQACGGVLFTRDSVDQDPELYDIQLTPRFGYVPETWEPLGSPAITYKRFRPIFIQRLCIGNDSCDQGTFSPGTAWIDGSPSTSDNVAAISAFSFHDNMLPGGLAGPDAPFDINVNLFLRLVR
jgi:hypothetical protein